jgi:hypothetical protein
MGANLDSHQGLTDQLRDYYLNPDADVTYAERYSEFAEVRGLDVEDGALDEDAEETLRTEVDDFAEAYSRRDTDTADQIAGGVLSNFDQDEPGSTAMTDQLIDFVNDGLAGEP